MTIELNYNDQKIPVSVGYYALVKFKVETGYEYTDQAEDKLEDLEVLFWYAIEAGYKKEKRENPFKREDAIMILDEVMIEFTEKIPLFFQTPQETSLQGSGAKRGKK
jgi:hypothetical protein